MVRPSTILLAMLTLFGLGCSKAPPPAANAPAATPAVGKETVTKKETPAAPVWKLDPAMATKLEPPVQACGFEIRPPKNYVADSPASAPQGLQVAGWTGERRADGVGPRLQLMVMSMPAGEAVPTLDIAAAKLMTAVQRRRTNWSETPIVYGSINGLAFAKQGWSGQEPNSGIEMRGVMFVAIAGDRIVQLHAQDTLESFDETMVVLEAAVMTIK